MTVKTRFSWSSQCWRTRHDDFKMFPDKFYDESLGLAVIAYRLWSALLVGDRGGGGGKKAPGGGVGGGGGGGGGGGQKIPRSELLVCTWRQGGHVSDHWNKSVFLLWELNAISM